MNVLILFFLIPHSVLAVCPNTKECIANIRSLSADSRKFWFGERWKDDCARKNRNPIDCYNPFHLRSYHSIGSRLFRVKTFHSDFLRDLRIFPRVTYRVIPGTYRACDHNYRFEERRNSDFIEVDSNMKPAEPFTTRYLPDIRWQNMDLSTSYLIAAVDVGFSTLNYLAYDFPNKTKILKHYRPSANFRFDTNPVAILIFVQNPEMNKFNNNIFIDEQSELFDLPKFMLSNRLERNLIGMNILLVSTDPFAIENQRYNQGIDNCPVLIRRKLLSENRWKFVQSFPLSEMDLWLSVEYRQHYSLIEFCCEKFELRESKRHLDPLGDGKLPSIVVLREPILTAMKTSQTNANYQRNPRDFFGIVLLDRLYTLVLFDPDDEYVYWMVTGIAPMSLVDSNIHEGITIAKYLEPVPATPKKCSIAIFMLFSSPKTSHSSIVTMTYHKHHPLRSSLCHSHCLHRSEFDIERFKSLHQLRINAMNWMKICYDVYEGARRISLNTSNNTTPANSFHNDSMHSISTHRFQTDTAYVYEPSATQQICSKMGMPLVACPISSTPKLFESIFFLLLILFFTLLRICLTQSDYH